MTIEHSTKDEWGVWRFKNGRMDMGKYKFQDGYLVEAIPPEEDACWEDNLTHQEYVEEKYEQRSIEQRKKYNESDRDEEERRLNERIS